MYSKCIKRVLDLIISIIAIIILIPIWIIIPVLIKLDDKGPVFYLSPRIGKNRKKIFMYKFRSMKVDNIDIRNADGSTYNSEDDSRVTFIGKVLRKTSIDELPQLFNVVKGEMSIIGPRASTWDALSSYKEDEIDKMKVLPGITGYCQAYYRNSISAREKRLKDAWYANNICFSLDIKIFFRTIKTVLLREGLYTNRGIHMKMLMMPAYFFPEQMSSTHLDQDRFEAYYKNNIDVEIIVATPTRGIDKKTYKEYKKIKYEEMYDGHVKVSRFFMFREGRNIILRAVRYCLINIIQFFKGIRTKNIDVIYSGSTPPTQGLLCSGVKKIISKKYKRKVPFVYCLQDIFPDSLVNAGLTSKGSLIWKIGRKIEDFTYSHADMIIVICEGFKRNIIEKGVPENKIVVISNWIDLYSTVPIEKKDNKLFDDFGIDRSHFIVVYAGNLGEAQGADVILDAAKRLTNNKDIKFVIFGGGAKYQEFKNRVENEKIDNVFVTGLQPQSRVSEVYSMGDVALITCKPGMGKSGLPSKTWSIMACNTPIIASFDMDSDLDDILKKSKSGKCVRPGDSEDLSDAILEKYNEINIKGYRKDNLRSYVENNASKEVCVKKYIEVINNVIYRRK